MSNVSAGTYTLYLYGKNDNAGDANRGTTFAVSVGATSYGTQSTVNSKDTLFTAGNDYVVFSGIAIPPGGGAITFTYTHNPAATGTTGNSEGDFNGVQLAPVTLYPPLITQQPLPEELYAGKTAHFTVAGSSQPTGAATFQWATNGVAIKNDGATGTGSVISGSKTATLTVSNVSAADQLSFQATLTGTDALTVKSTAVPLTIVAPSGEAYEASVISEQPLYFYQFNEVGNPATNNTVAFDYEGGDNGIYGTNALNGNTNDNISAARRPRWAGLVFRRATRRWNLRAGL